MNKLGRIHGRNRGMGRIFFIYILLIPNNLSIAKSCNLSNALHKMIDLGAMLKYNCTMLENRKNPRYQSLAHVRIPGVSGGENILKDISVTGCCVECTGEADLRAGTQYHIEIQPEQLANIDKFKLTVERKWVQSGDYSTEIGFFILASPKGRQFQRYVDYLSYRSQG